jgi:hypothetical protein
MASRLMSDAEIKRRKKLQGHISQATGALGLTALGGTLLATKRGGKASSAAFKAVGTKRPKALHPKKLKGHTAPILATSAGIGGLGAFNFAAYTGAESRKRNMTKPVKKSYETIEMGFYGEEGHPVKLPEIKVPIEKAWSPSASNYDSERKREGRNKVYEAGALSGAGLGGAAAAHYGIKAGKSASKLKGKEMAPTGTSPTGRKVAYTTKAEHAVSAKHLKALGKHGGKATAGVATVGAAALAHGAIKRRREGSWQPYAKRDTASAFGVDHSSDGGDPTT